MPTATHLKCQKSILKTTKYVFNKACVVWNLVDTLDFGPENNDFPSETFKDNLDEWYSRTKSKCKIKIFGNHSTLKEKILWP